MNRCIAHAAALAAGLLLASPAHADTYPSAPVKLLMGFPAGGPPDTVGRRVAEMLGARLGQPVVVENRPGASGTIAAAAVAHGVPDGHTLLFGVAANLAVAPATLVRPPYDPRSAFAPVIEVARGPYVWVVRADSPAHSMREFVDWSRRHPGRLNYGTPGIGTVQHLVTEMLEQRTGIHMVHIPYRGLVHSALLAGEVHAMFDSMPGPLPHLAAGRVRALAVTGPRRLAALPDVPTFAEQALPDLDVNSWWGIVAPAGTPTSVIVRLNHEIAQVLRDAELSKALAAWGIEATPGTPEAFGAYIAQEYLRWKTQAQTMALPRE